MISLKVDTLRALSQCFGVKRSSGAKKAVLIGRLLSYCELGILKDVTEEGERAGGEDDGNAYGNTRHATAEEKTVLKTLPDFKTVTTGWTKDLTALQKLSFVDIFTYLVESRESTFDKEKMEAYKSLKGVKYMEDGLVRNLNVWSKSSEPGDQVIFFKAHIHALLDSYYVLLHFRCHSEPWFSLPCNMQLPCRPWRDLFACGRLAILYS